MRTHDNKRHPKKSNNRALRIVCIAVLTVLILTVAVIGAGIYYFKNAGFGADTDRPSYADNQRPPLADTDSVTDGDGKPVGGTAEETQPDDEGPVYIRDTEIVNFLLMGRDRDAWNTDVMMIVNLNMREESLNIVQIPRDTYTEIDGMHGRLNTMMKIKRNAAARQDSSLSSDELTKAGMRIMADALEESLCIKIDGCVIVNLEGFRNIIEIIGGVYIDVPYDMDYDDPDQDLYIHLKAGPQTLNGDEAEQFVRFRADYVQGDIGRVNAQKIFLTALFKQLKNNFNFTTIWGITEQAMNHVVTDLSFESIVACARELLGVDMEKVSMMTLPGKDARASSGAWYYVMNRADTLTLINEYFNVYNLPVTDEQFDPYNGFTAVGNSTFEEIYFAEGGNAEVETADKIDGGELVIPMY